MLNITMTYLPNCIWHYFLSPFKLLCLLFWHGIYVQMKGYKKILIEEKKMKNRVKAKEKRKKNEGDWLPFFKGGKKEEVSSINEHLCSNMKAFSSLIWGIWQPQLSPK